MLCQKPEIFRLLCLYIVQEIGSFADAKVALVLRSTYFKDGIIPVELKVEPAPKQNREAALRGDASCG